MGLRFRKSFKIAPGVKLNLNKRSSSVTFGNKNVHYTINSKGKRTKTISIPGTGINYSASSGGTSGGSQSYTQLPNDVENISPTPPVPEPDNSDKPKRGCLTYLLYFFIFCIAFSLRSYVWIPGIISIVYFAIREKDSHLKKKKIIASSIITFVSLLFMLSSGSAPELTGIEAYWMNTDFDIHDTTEVKITPVPEDADLDDLKISSNNIASLNYEDGKATVSFKNEGTASIFFTANDSINSNSIDITVIDKEAEAAKKAEEERIKAEQEAAKKAEEERIKAEQEAAKKAEEERIRAEQEAAKKAEEERIKAEQEAQQKAEEARIQAEQQQPKEAMVWIPATGSKYHSNSSCSNMNNPTQVTESEAISRGYSPCKRCY